MDMVKSRNLTSHTYDEATAAQIISSIRNTYFKAFEELRVRIDELKREHQA